MSFLNSLGEDLLARSICWLVLSFSCSKQQVSIFVANQQMNQGSTVNIDITHYKMSISNGSCILF
jgi:hypothetical protein